MRTSLRLTEGGWGQYEVWVCGPKKAEVWARIRDAVEQIKEDAEEEPQYLPAPRVNVSGWHAPTAHPDERRKLHLKMRSPSRRPRALARPGTGQRARVDSSEDRVVVRENTAWKWGRKPGSGQAGRERRWTPRGEGSQGCV